MVNSMTGYGRAQQKFAEREVTVEIRAVNHRFFEFSARIPRSYGYLEEKLKTLIGEKVFRGKVEAAVSVVNIAGTGTEVQVNFELARSYAAALRTLEEPLGLCDDLSLSAFSRLPDIFTVYKIEEDAGAVWEDVRQTAEAALGQFLEMRRREGGRLQEDILKKAAAIESYVGEVERRSPETVNEYRERLYQKMKELVADRAVEDARVLQEAGIFADRVAVDEETVRLRSHLCELRAILESPGPCGRKLDFLLQEVNRETNTIGSKAQDAALARTVVEMKSEIEKIREQIQNLE
ncbi:MAG: YicC family protein [Provencibacterium sp.]|jgi:uncharacterized protein (TIGR00255 family)|nr:YicC family protein [Provencibacterium sp.]